MTKPETISQQMRGDNLPTIKENMNTLVDIMKKISESIKNIETRLNLRM